MKYKQIVVHRFGGAEVLEIEEETFRPLETEKVRIKIHAAGVAWGDILNRQGFGMARPLFVPGYDVVGMVDDIGKDVTSVKVGQMVAAMPITGGYAEFIHLPASELVPVPAGIDPAEAVCLVMNYVVAHQLLHRAARVGEGEHALVYSASGGVGTALLQLGKLAGLEMYGVTSKDKMDLVSGMDCIPLDREAKDLKSQIIDMTGGRLEVAFDPFGGRHAREAYGLLGRGGRVVVYGAHTVALEGLFKMILGSTVNLLLNLIPDTRQMLNYGVMRPKYSSPAWCREDLSGMLDLLAQGKIKPVVAARIPLVEAARAHELLEGGGLKGKAVLICNVL